jgi:hypothetical protein
MRRELAFGLLLALCCCSATGAKFRDHRAHTEPLPADRGRVVVYRLDKAQYSTVVATTEIDGLVFGSLRENGFVWHDIDTAAHLLRADVPSDPGTCLLPFQLAAGETGYFLVAPRGAYAAAKAPGTVAQFIADALVQGSDMLPHLASEAVIQAGATLESAGKRCGGPFSVVRVPPAAAEPLVMELRESK